MWRILVLVSLASLSACAAMPGLFPVITADTDEVAPAQLAEADAALVGDEVTIVDATVPESRVICRSRERAGSRIKETVCFDSEEYAAQEALRSESVKADMHALEMERRNREIAQDQIQRDRLGQMMRR